MDSIASFAARAILFGLDPAIEAELAASLRGASYDVSRSVAFAKTPGRAPGEGRDPRPGSEPDGGIVFCPRGAAFAAAKATFPNLPVVIVSRLPDTRDWLEALELGAADYVAAPFESIQMRWLLESHARPAQAMAAAASGQNTHVPKCA